MSLPPELVEQIIDNLSNDRPELLACSAVARVWRPRALAHLFRCIRICQPGLPRNAGGGMIPLTPCEFNELRKRSPHLLHLVRDLLISVENPYLPLDELLHFVRTMALPQPCAVSSLKFAAIGAVDWGNGLFDDFAARFPTLRRVEVDTEELFPLSELSIALAVAQELVLHAPGLYHESMPLSIEHLFPETPLAILTLRSLELFNDPLRLNRHCYYYVTRLGACAPNLARVALREITLHTLETMVIISHGFSNLICELSLHTARKTQFETHHLAAAFEHCANLRVLEITIHQDSLVLVQLPYPPPLPQRLEALRFVSRGLLAAFVDGVAACTDWRAWDAAADRLRAVSFTFVGASGGKEHRSSRGFSSQSSQLEDVMKGLLPGAYAAGRLEWRVEARTDAPAGVHANIM